MTNATLDVVHPCDRGLNYRVFIHLPKTMEGFRSDEDALKNGYTPLGKPSLWFVGLHDGIKGLEDIEFAGILNFNDSSIPKQAEAYVFNEKIWEDGIPRFMVGAQWYKKDNPQ